MMTKSPSVAGAAQALVQARQSGIALANLGADAPDTLAAAYAIQDATLALIGPVGGWKVGPGPDGTPRCAALPLAGIQMSGAQYAAPNGCEVEVETAFVLRDDLAPGTPLTTPAQVMAAVGAIRLAFEVLGTRYTDRKAVGPLEGIADLQSHGGVVLGAEVPGWRDVDLGALDMALQVNGMAQQTPQRHTSLAETLPSLIWLADHAARRGHPFGPGTIIISGARIGPYPVPAMAEVRAECSGLGHVTMQVTG